MENPWRSLQRTSIVKPLIVLRRLVEPNLYSTVTMVDKFFAGSSSPDGLFESVEGDIRFQRRRDSPTDDGSREDIRDEGHVDEARPCRDVGDVGDPQLIRPLRLKAPFDEVERSFGAIARGRNDLESSTTSDTRKAHFSHRSLHGASSHRDAFLVERDPDLLRAVDEEVLVIDAENLGLQLFVSQCTSRSKLGLLSSSSVQVVGSWGDGQDPAHRLDPKTPLDGPQ